MQIHKPRLVEQPHLIRTYCLGDIKSTIKTIKAPDGKIQITGQSRLNAFTEKLLSRPLVQQWHQSSSALAKPFTLIKAEKKAKFIQEIDLAQSIEEILNQNQWVKNEKLKNAFRKFVTEFFENHQYLMYKSQSSLTSTGRTKYMEDKNEAYYKVTQDIIALKKLLLHKASLEFIHRVNLGRLFGISFDKELDFAFINVYSTKPLEQALKEVTGLSNLAHYRLARKQTQNSDHLFQEQVEAAQQIFKIYSQNISNIENVAKSYKRDLNYLKTNEKFSRLSTSLIQEAYITCSGDKEKTENALKAALNLWHHLKTNELVFDPLNSNLIRHLVSCRKKTQKYLEDNLEEIISPKDPFIDELRKAIPVAFQKPEDKLSTRLQQFLENVRRGWSQ